MEERIYPLSGVEVRADGDQPVITGYAAVFDQLSVKLWGEFRERIQRGAFEESLRNDIRALWNHNDDYVLGRRKNGTLSLAEDARGLAFEIRPPNTQQARDFVETIRSGYVDAMSFGFTVPSGGDEWERSEDGEQIRTVKRANLIEISPVSFPAYPQTSAEVRSVALGDKPQIPTLEGPPVQENGAKSARARSMVRRRRAIVRLLEHRS